MNNIIALNISTPNEIAKQIAAKVKARRLEDFDALFAQKQYQSLDDVLNEQNVTRKRGKKNE